MPTTRSSGSRESGPCSAHTKSCQTTTASQEGNFWTCVGIMAFACSSKVGMRFTRSMRAVISAWQCEEPHVHPNRNSEHPLGVREEKWTQANTAWPKSLSTKTEVQKSNIRGQLLAQCAPTVLTGTHSSKRSVAQIQNARMALVTRLH